MKALKILVMALGMSLAGLTGCGGGDPNLGPMTDAEKAALKAKTDAEKAKADADKAAKEAADKAAEEAKKKTNP